MALKRHPWTPMKMLQLAICTPNAQNLATIAAFLLGFHSTNQAPPTKNSSAIATITIKPERLAHLCVEQDLLYPWMCFTSWFELHRSQDECFLHHLQHNFTQGDLFCCVRQCQTQLGVDPL